MSASANTIGGASTSTTAPLPVAVTIDPVVDLIPIYTSSASATQAISRNTYLGLTSNPSSINDVQTITNKTFNNTNVLTIKAANFTIQDGTDTTKQAQFIASGITTGTTRSYTLPNASDTIVGLTATQTLTNKTLTSPVINSPTITNATITTDTVTGYTVSNTGSIFGLTVAVGALTVPGALTVTGASTLTGAVSTVGQLSVQTGTAPPAAGAASAGIKVSSTANLGVFYGSGAPTFSAAQGAIYLRTDGSSPSPRLYVNTTGSTTWTSFTSAA